MDCSQSEGSGAVRWRWKERCSHEQVMLVEYRVHQGAGAWLLETRNRTKETKILRSKVDEMDE